MAEQQGVSGCFLPQPWRYYQDSARLWRVTDTITGNIVFFPPDSVGSVVFNAAETAATIYLDFEVPGQGNNTVPKIIEVTGQDALDLAVACEAAFVCHFEGEGSA